MTALTLEVDDRIYSGWKSVNIMHSLETISGVFKLTFNDQWSKGLNATRTTPGTAKNLPIKAGQHCKVRIFDETIITGHLDSVAIEYGADTHNVSAIGRDATGDLVDCAAIYKGGQWSSATLFTIASDLCKPFGIEVFTNVPVGEKFKNYGIETGESVFECLERAARVGGFLLNSDGQGRLIITRMEPPLPTVKTPLQRGVNILRARGEFSLANQHSKYTVYGYNPGPDQVLEAIHVNAEVEDKRIKRYRPTIIHAEANINYQKAKDIANWEQSVRAGRGSRIVYTVQGWQHQNGPWRPGVLVTVNDDWMGIPTQSMLIVSVGHTLGDNGSLTELTLMPPEAFSRIPIPEAEDRDLFFA